MEIDKIVVAIIYPIGMFLLGYSFGRSTALSTISEMIIKHDLDKSD